MPRTFAALWLCVATVAMAGPAFPLRVADGGRYLEDQNGAPFPVLGDSAWSASHNLSATDQATYLDDRVSRAFTAVLTEAIEHKFTVSKPPKDLAGNLPFTTRLDGAAFTGSPNGCTTANGSGSWTGASADTYAADPYAQSNQAPDFTTPNATYWSSFDGFIAACAQRGLVVFLFPAYVGYGGGDEGWMSELVDNDTVIGAGGFVGQTWANNSKSRTWNYGAWLGQHYATTSNLIWVLGGDYGGFTTAQLAAEQSLLDGIRSVPNQASTLWTSHWARGSLGTDVATFAPAMNLESVYTPATVAAQARSGYSHTPALPAFELEDVYENASVDPVRQEQWAALLNAIGGHFFGNEHLWPFDSANGGWQANLASPAAADMAQLNAFWLSLPWQTLVPSGLAGQRTLISANGGDPSADDYVSCAADLGGNLEVCYAPPARQGAAFTVDATALSAPFRARWFNPHAGGYTLIAAVTSNTGGVVYTPPGDNGSGSSDWVLVLDVASSGDAGTPDGGVPDAGPADAGAVDAGAADAAVSDSGTADAGISDAGHADAGIFDAGTDGGSIGDAGENSDGGTGTDGSAHGVCGCSTTNGIGMLLLSLIWALRRRARRLEG